MKITNFSISFDSTGRVFHVGNRISGSVKVAFAKPTKLRGIKLFLEGSAKSYWDEKHGKNKTKYRARETYINQTILLFGGTSETVIHPVGNYTYPFNFPLNADIPSSYEGRRGYVRYTCKAILDRPWKFNESIKEPFTVVRHLDCNQLISALNPIYEHQRQVIEGCCCEEGSIDVEFNINKTAFVPGEPLVYDITVKNNSDNAVTELYLMLRQESTFTGYSDSLFSSGKPHLHTKVESFSLFNQPVNVRKNANKKFSGASTIPSLVPSLLEGCNIINIQYFVSLKVPCGWSSVKANREIIIGTIPAREFHPSIPRNATVNQVSPSQIELSVRPPPPEMLQPTAPPAYEDLPPSYAECIFGGVDIRDENDDEHTTLQRNWAPAYTYYNWNQQNYAGPQPEAVRPAPPSYNAL